MNTKEKIEQLCESWINSVLQPNGAITIGQDSYGYGLLNNGIKYHELSYEEIKAALVGLTPSLLLRNQSIIITEDHTFLWAWFGELFLCPLNKLYLSEPKYRELMHTIVRAALAGAQRLPENKEEFMIQREISKFRNRHTSHLEGQRLFLMAYLGFPFLESTIKLESSQYIDIDGKAVKPFTVIRSNGKSKDYQVGQQCSSLKDLLILFTETVGQPTTVSDLKRIKVMLEKIVSGDAYDTIYGWRNGTLHSAQGYHTIGGTLVNMAFLVCLERIKVKYNEYRENAVKMSRHYSKIEGVHGEFSCYPPY